MALSFYNPGLNCEGKTCVELPRPEDTDFCMWDIGRSEKSFIRLASTQASRRHFRIHYNNGEYWIQDMNSENGTYLDGKKIEPGKEVKLKPFASIFAGGVRMVWLNHCDETLPDHDFAVACDIEGDSVRTVSRNPEAESPSNVWGFSTNVIQQLIAGLSDPTTRWATLLILAIATLVVVILWGN